jgi:hypothetical protein
VSCARSGNRQSPRAVLQLQGRVLREVRGASRALQVAKPHIAAFPQRTRCLSLVLLLSQVLPSV